ncbi:hypothetical protein AVEN_6932-1 [Araneus ventricosus]|uniref:Uncharacterized protein n=1 Tax=Araneus ventricosus TaxID=182803 RepID=A0A4Y2TCR2_ARAVE|nr:hypothetical protein AVEN_6932-1 [Araneus ventricosus]
MTNNIDADIRHPAPVATEQDDPQPAAQASEKVGFSKAGSISRRAKISVLAYQQPAQKWHNEENEMVTGYNPTTLSRKYLNRNNNEHLKRLNSGSSSYIHKRWR